MTCQACSGQGFDAIDLRGLWRGRPAFLVCGGPSLYDYPLNELRERGVASLGINQAAAFAPCKAFHFSDSLWKFHFSLFFDPTVLCFVPIGKLFSPVRARLRDGTFRTTDVLACNCPAVVGISRDSKFEPSEFFTTSYAHWGKGEVGDKRLCTMVVGIRLLHYLGCPRAYLLGVDHRMPDKAAGYAWGQASSGERPFARIEAMLEAISPVCRENGLEVYNCNERSKSKAFPHRPWHEAIRDCRGPVPREPYDLDNWYWGSVKDEHEKKYPKRITQDELMEKM